MPELPEVETMVRGIRASVAGRRILELRACPCSCRPITTKPLLAEMQSRCRNLTITAVRRRAKRVVLELSSGEAFVIEPRMTGLMLIDQPPDQEHLRLEWRLKDGRGGSCLWFWDQRGLGVVHLMSESEYAELLSTNRLGRDALEMTIEDWKRFSSSTATPVKVALLDQKRVAGIGNLYASEILHRARIHPETPADELTAAQLRRLTETTTQVLEEAIRYEGSTLSDGTYRNALNQAGGYQNAHRVYDREGERCPTCGRATIERIVQAQRSTFFCPRCQKRSTPENRRPGTQRQSTK